METVGIFSGTFDPVHKGHVAFALEAVKKASLSKVYFLPERAPRRKNRVSDFEHRVQMLELALTPHSALEVLILPEQKFTLSETLPKLKKSFADTQIIFLAGSDVLPGMLRWGGLKPLIIGLRAGDNEKTVRKILAELGVANQTHILKSPQADASSSSLRRGEGHASLEPAVLAYIKRYRLY